MSKETEAKMWPRYTNTASVRYTYHIVFKTNGNGCIDRVYCDTNESITTKAAYMAMEDALEAEILAVTLLETHLDAERRIDLANYLYGED